MSGSASIDRPHETLLGGSAAEDRHLKANFICICSAFVRG